jgi:hypothetical protein
MDHGQQPVVDACVSVPRVQQVIDAPIGVGGKHRMAGLGRQGFCGQGIAIGKRPAPTLCLARLHGR